MRLPDPLRTSIFRLTIFFALGSAATSLVLFAFIYWQTAVYERDRTASLLAQEVAAVSSETDIDLRRAVASRLESDIHHVAYAALFDAKGQLIAGNLASIPPGLEPDGVVRSVEVDRDSKNGDRTITQQRILAVAKRLPDASVLLIGRNIDELRNLRSVVTRSLLLGVIPALTLALFAGAFLSRRFQLKIIAANQTLRRIMRGNLHERLPVADKADDFDQMAVSVNQMLDEIERMVDQIRGAADSIAHDVRVPLVQMHTRLERTRTQYQKSGDINAIVDHALSDLDVALGMITGLTRIAEIQDDRRRKAFTTVDLAEVMRSVFDLYEPMAEEKSLTFTISSGQPQPVRGDADLLRDLVSNLIDNAIKFTPTGGTVAVSVAENTAARNVVARVSDTGPGIAEQERGAVFERFYRSTTTQDIPGHGLGLSLVRVVCDLHGFDIRISGAAPGATFELICPSLS
ncbi:MAG TPA: ATP-binding protein [Magnetospirillaceae bacterium]|jgi:signal transduction histidine kinase